MCEIDTFTQKATKPDDGTEFRGEKAHSPQNITVNASSALMIAQSRTVECLNINRTEKDPKQQGFEEKKRNREGKSEKKMSVTLFKVTPCHNTLFQNNHQNSYVQAHKLIRSTNSNGKA